VNINSLGENQRQKTTPQNLQKRRFLSGVTDFLGKNTLAVGFFAIFCFDNIIFHLNPTTFFQSSACTFVKKFRMFYL